MLIYLACKFNELVKYYVVDSINVVYLFTCSQTLLFYSSAKWLPQKLQHGRNGPRLYICLYNFEKFIKLF